MIEKSKIIEKINEFREVLALEIREFRDSKQFAIEDKRWQDNKRDEISEKKLTAVFVFLGKLLQNCKTDAELKSKIIEKIQSNDSTINAFCEILIKTYEPACVRMIKEITSENNLYKSILAANDESDSGLQNPAVVKV